MHQRSDHLVAYKRLLRLIATLKDYVQRDPEQEVRGIAIPALDAVLTHAKGVIDPNDAVVHAVADIISPESIGAGEPIRAADALIVAQMLFETLGSPPEMQTGGPRGPRRRGTF